MAMARRSSLTRRAPSQLHHVVRVGAADEVRPRSHDRPPAFEHRGSQIGAGDVAPDGVSQRCFRDLEHDADFCRPIAERAVKPWTVNWLARRLRISIASAEQLSEWGPSSRAGCFWPSRRQPSAPPRRRKRPEESRLSSGFKVRIGANA